MQSTNSIAKFKRALGLGRSGGLKNGISPTLAQDAADAMLSRGIVPPKQRSHAGRPGNSPQSSFPIRADTLDSKYLHKPFSESDLRHL